MLESKTTFSKGELIAGKYRVLSIAGSGGMGVVYCARDEHLERTVALKFLPTELNASEGDRDRFLREARTASKLDHPNIGVIHGIEKTENDLTFIVMAFYDGPSLAERIHNRPLPATEAIGIARQMAQGLAAAHSQGIVHRDVKPSNVMLTGSGLAKIVDFGLARVMTQTTASQTGIEGTVQYMSPEQVTNRSLDQRCDIWALGVVFAEMLTGIPPFQADNVSAVLFSILNEAPKGFETVHPQLQPILYRALAKDPDRRYGTCAEFLADLATTEKQISQRGLGLKATREVRRFMLPERSSALRRRLQHDASNPAESGKWKEDGGWKVWLLGAMAAVFAMLLAAWLIHPVRERFVALITGRPSIKRVAVLPFEFIGGNPQSSALADGLMESFTGYLSNLDVSGDLLWIVPTTEVRRRHVVEPAEALNMLGANFVIKGLVERNGYDIHLTVNLIDTVKLRQVGSAMVEDSSGDLASLENQAVVRLAKLMKLPVPDEMQRAENGKVAPAAYEAYLTALGLMQRWDKPGNLDQAIAILNDTLKTNPEFALGYAQLGEAYRMKSAVETTSKWLPEAETNAQKAVTFDNRIPSAYVTLGSVHSVTGKLDLALDEFQNALRLDPRNADAIAGLGRAYELAGRLPDAEAAYHKAADIQPNDWNGYNNLAMFLGRHDRYTEAITEYHKALRLAPDNAQVLQNLGGTYVDTGDPKYMPDAESALKKSIALNPIFGSYANLGALYLREGKYNEAVEVTRKALTINSQNYIVWINLLNCYERLNDTENAKDAARHAIRLAEEAVRQNPREATAFGYLAGLFAFDHQREKALANLRTGLALAPDDPGILIEAAHVYENFGDRPQAVEYVRKAIKHGATKEELVSDPDLQNLLNDPAAKDLWK